MPVPQEFEYLGSVDFNPYILGSSFKYGTVAYFIKKILLSVGGGFLCGDPHGLVRGAGGGG